MSDKLHDISLNTVRNANMTHDVILDVNKPNDAVKIPCPLNVVQRSFQ